MHCMLMQDVPIVISMREIEAEGNGVELNDGMGPCLQVV